VVMVLVSSRRAALISRSGFEENKNVDTNAIKR